MRQRAIGMKQALTGTLIMCGGHTGVVGRDMDGTSWVGGVRIPATSLSISDALW
jgi:hypothetical protein